MDKQILQVSSAYFIMKYGSLALQQYFNWYNRKPVDHDHIKIKDWLGSSNFNNLKTWYNSVDFSKNIHPDYDDAFRFACINGYVNVAKWLLESNDKICAESL